MRHATYTCDVCGGAVEKAGQLLLRNCEADLCIVCPGTPWAKKLIAKVAEHAGQAAAQGYWAQFALGQRGGGKT